MILNPITHGIFDPAVPRGGWIPSSHWKTHSEGSETNYFFYRIMNLYKTRQNPIVQAPSLKNGLLEICFKVNFFALSEMRKNMVSGEKHRNSFKF